MKTTELRDKSQTIALEARELLNTIKDDNSNSAEVTEQFERMMKDSDGYAARAKMVEDAEARSKEFDAIVTETPSNVSEARGAGDDQEEKRAKAFEGYLRGQKSLGEMRAMGVATDPQGGALVPTGFINRLITRLRTEGPMLDPTLVNYLVTESGNPIEMPTFDDNVRAVIIAENTEIPAGDLVFNSKNLGAFKYTSKMVRVSSELIQDAAVDVPGVVSSALGKRIGRGLNEDLTTGTGTGMPEGIAYAVEKITAALTNAVAPEELFALQHAIDPAYRANATWMFSDAILLKLRTMKDTTGQFIWSPGFVDAPATILGSPYRINPFMDSAFTTGKTVALYGDFKSYTVRQVRDVYVRRLDERFADFDQVGFVSLARFDGKLLDTSAIKALKLA